MTSHQMGSTMGNFFFSEKKRSHDGGRWEKKSKREYLEDRINPNAKRGPNFLGRPKHTRKIKNQTGTIFGSSDSSPRAKTKHTQYNTTYNKKRRSENKSKTTVHFFEDSVNQNLNTINTHTSSDYNSSSKKLQENMYEGSSVKISSDPDSDVYNTFSKHKSGLLSDAHAENPAQ